METKEQEAKKALSLLKLKLDNNLNPLGISVEWKYPKPITPKK